MTTSEMSVRALYVCYLAFIGIGAANTLLGALLPALSARLTLTDLASGNLFVAQSLGSLIGTVLSGRSIQKFGYQATSALGVALTAGAMIGIGWLDWHGVLLAFLLNGFGLGLSIPGINLFIAAKTVNKVAALNILNFAWGIGALLGQPLVNFFGAPPHNVRLPVAMLALLLVVSAMLLLLTARRESVQIEQSITEYNRGQLLLLLPIALLLFVYVGVEQSVGGWIASYSLRLQLANNLLLTPVTAFWAAFMLARLVAPLFIRRIAADDFLILCSTLIVFGLALLLLANTFEAVILAVFLAGFGLGPVFPTTIARTAERLGEATMQQTSWLLFVSATLGGACITWSVGVVSTSLGSLRAGLFVTLIAGILIFVFQIISVRLTTRR